MTPEVLKPRLDEESDVSLMKMLTEDSVRAEAALKALYNRHGGFLKAVAVGSHVEAKGVDPDLIVGRTFQKVWQRAKSFDPRKQYQKTDLNRAVRLWMLVILRNELRDQLKAAVRRVENDDYDDDREIPAAKKIKEASVPFFVAKEKSSERRRVFDEWFETLSADDQKILYASARHIQPTPPYRCYIPADELAALADELGVTPATIKVKRPRLFKRCRDFFRRK